MRRTRWLLAVAGAYVPACVHYRDFDTPMERIVENTAYVDQQRMRVTAGLVGREDLDKIADAGIGVTAVRERLSFRANLAHATIGVANVAAKFNIVDTRWYGIGGRIGFIYLTPRTFWFLPDDLRRTLGDIHLVSLPVEIVQSFPFVSWFHLHVGVSYRVAALWGQLATDDLAAKAQLGTRSLEVSPYLHFYIAHRVALIAGANLPVLARVAEVADAEVAVRPGIVAGVNSVEWKRRDFTDTFRTELASELRLGRTTHMRLSVTVGSFRPFDRLLVMPSLNLYWRFL